MNAGGTPGLLGRNDATPIRADGGRASGGGTGGNPYSCKREDDMPEWSMVFLDGGNPDNNAGYIYVPPEEEKDDLDLKIMARSMTKLLDKMPTAQASCACWGRSEGLIHAYFDLDVVVDPKEYGDAPPNFQAVKAEWLDKCAQLCVMVFKHFFREDRSVLPMMNMYVFMSVNAEDEEAPKRTDDGRFKWGFHVHFPSVIVTLDQMMLMQKCAVAMFEKEFGQREARFPKSSPWSDVIDKRVYKSGIRMPFAFKCADCPDCLKKNRSPFQCGTCRGEGKRILPYYYKPIGVMNNLRYSVEHLLDLLDATTGDAATTVLSHGEVPLGPPKSIFDLDCPAQIIEDCDGFQLGVFRALKASCIRQRAGDVLTPGFDPAGANYYLSAPEMREEVAAAGAKRRRTVQRAGAGAGSDPILEDEDDEEEDEGSRKLKKSLGDPIDPSTDLGRLVVNCGKTVLPEKFAGSFAKEVFVKRNSAGKRLRYRIHFGGMDGKFCPNINDYHNGASTSVILSCRERSAVLYCGCKCHTTHRRISGKMCSEFKLVGTEAIAPEIRTQLFDLDEKEMEKAQKTLNLDCTTVNVGKQSEVDILRELRRVLMHRVFKGHSVEHNGKTLSQLVADDAKSRFLIQSAFNEVDTIEEQRRTLQSEMTDAMKTLNSLSETTPGNMRRLRREGAAFREERERAVARFVDVNDRMENFVDNIRRTTGPSVRRNTNPVDELDFPVNVVNVRRK